jgi:hypothetical protein
VRAPARPCVRAWVRAVSCTGARVCVYMCVCVAGTLWGTKLRLRSGQGSSTAPLVVWELGIITWLGLTREMAPLSKLVGEQAHLYTWFGLAFRWIHSPSEHVLDKLSGLRSKTAGKIVVAMQVRTGAADGTAPTYRAGNEYQLALKCTLELLSSMCKNLRRVPSDFVVLLVSDNDRIKQSARFDLEPFPTMTSEGAVRHFGHLRGLANVSESFVHTIVDLHLLRLAHDAVLTDRSNFAKLAVLANLYTPITPSKGACPRRFWEWELGGLQC